MSLKNKYDNRKRFTKTPVDNTGMWYQDNPVIVPSNQITMKGPNGEPNYFDSPIMGIGMQSGEKKVMYPGKEYSFPNDRSVYERKMQGGGELLLDATSMIPGPVGMSASAVGLGYDLVTGDWLGAGLNTANIITGGTSKALMSTARGLGNIGARNAARVAASGSHKLNRASKIANNYSKPVDRTRNIINTIDDNYSTQFGGYRDNAQITSVTRPIKPKMQTGGLYAVGPYDEMMAPKKGNYLLPDINRPSYNDEFGGMRSEYRIGFNSDGKETLIPTVIQGKQLSDDEAIDNYYRTGLYIGKYNTVDEAEYASKMRTAKYNMLQDPVRFNMNNYQVGGITPIYTSNPKDPRLKSYNDSLSLYNQTRTIENPKYYGDYEEGPKFYWYNSKNSNDLYNFSKRNNINRDKNYISIKTGKYPKNIRPIGTGDFGRGNIYFKYKKPVQPVIYKKEEVQQPIIDTLVEKPIPTTPQQPTKNKVILKRFEDTQTQNGQLERLVELSDGQTISFSNIEDYNDWKADKDIDMRYTQIKHNVPYGSNINDPNDISNRLKKATPYKKKSMQVGGETSTEDNPLRMSPIDIKVKRKYRSDNSEYTFDNKGNIFYKPLDPKAKELKKIKLNKLNPTLEEVINTVGQDSPIDITYKNESNKVVLPPSNYLNSLTEEYIIPEVMGKSFGKLEENTGHFLDEGYSKNRMWTNIPVTSIERTTKNLANPNLNTYFLEANTNIPGYTDLNYKSGLVTGSIQDQIYNTGSEPVPAEKGSEDYEALGNNWFSPTNSWNRSRQLSVEMQNNPEIREWAKLHNVDLSSKPRPNNDGKNRKQQTGEYYAPRLAEQILANRGVSQGDKIVGPPLMNYEQVRVIQDPSAFNLVGYADNNTVQSFIKDYKTANNIPIENEIPLDQEYVFQKALFDKLGIKADPNKVYTHFNRSTLDQYTPGKSMQKGGLKKSYLKTKRFK